MRKSTLLIGTALAGVMAAGATANAASEGWYVSGGVGANWVDDDSFATTTFFSGSFSSFTTTLAGSVDYDTGWALMAAIGYRFAGNWRLEGEFSGRWDDLSSSFSGAFYSASITGDVQTTALLANIVYDLNIADQLNLSLGGGVGYGWVDYEANFAGTFTTTFFPTTFTYTTSGTFSDDNSGFAYQLIAGLDFEVSDTTELFVEYRYFGINDDDSSTLRGLDDYTANTVLVGVRASLGQQ